MAVCVAVPPLGVLTVKVTLAPEAGVAPLVTEAVMGTLPGGEKFVTGTEMLTVRVGGVITVAFAVPDAVSEFFAAFTLTA